MRKSQRHQEAYMCGYREYYGRQKGPRHDGENIKREEGALEWTIRTVAIGDIMRLEAPRGITL